VSGPQELRLPVGWGELAALAWRRPGRPRVLCLHGWMDNAASFMPLAECLADCDLVALEYAGHGHSDHRPPGAHYHFHDYVFDLDAALDALGWERAVLIGHSLGSGVAATLACAAPERVSHLAMLDGMGVMTEPEDRVPERLRRSLRSVRDPRRHRRVFECVEDAARLRQASMPMADRSAHLLAERALVACEGGWRWRTDARAMWESPFWMTEGQCHALLSAITCPVLVLRTPVLGQYLGDRLDTRIARLRDGREVQVAGGHHAHMDDADAAATELRPFIDTEN